MKHHYTWMFLLFFLFAGCATMEGQPYTVEGFLDDTKTRVLQAAVGLKSAIDLGVVDTGSREYAQARGAIVRARDMLDAAYAAYRAGDATGAQQKGDVALAIYLQIRPLLYDLTGEPL